MITVKYLFPFTNKKARFHSKMSAQSSNKTNNYHKEAPKTPKLHKISTKTNNLNQEPTQSKWYLSNHPFSTPSTMTAPTNNSSSTNGTNSSDLSQ